MNKFRRILLFVLVLSIALIQPICSTMTAGAASDVTVNLASIKQVIRGFGTCTAWNNVLTDTEMNYLFKDMGLNILRLRIDPNKS
ncbi:MAG: hypothetical protein Q8942_00510 [Bacillota bacterium]|nr:hypothetical protein [Bacillota bacterium]